MVGRHSSGRPNTSEAHDYLFAQPLKSWLDRPPGAKDLARLYLENNRLPRAHEHRLFQTCVDDLIRGEAGPLDAAIGRHLDKVRGAYATCFEPHHRHVEAVSICPDPDWREKLSSLRHTVTSVAEVDRRMEAEPRERSRLHYESMYAPLDKQGETRLDIIKQLTPDDWHSIVHHWNWDVGVEELEWIASQPECDLRTAVYVMCLGNLRQVAFETKSFPTKNEDADLAWRIAIRIASGFYEKAELKLWFDYGMTKRYGALIADMRALEHPWRGLPEDLIADDGRRPLVRYEMADDKVGWDFGYWREHVFPRTSVHLPPLKPDSSR